MLKQFITGIVILCAGLPQLTSADIVEASLRPLARGEGKTTGGITIPTRPPKKGTDAGLKAWIRDFKPRALEAGITAKVFDTALTGVTYDEQVIRRDRNQSEFTKTIWNYLDTAVSDLRVENGRKALAKWDNTLSKIETKYGVEKEVVVAIWGLESRYGERRGDIQVVSALSTLAYDGRRGSFFESQLIAALKILQNGDVTADRMTGSWAGAMGHTQFIPTSYQAFAVDFTGDGRRDIWSDDPSDALASTAAYLARSGWQRSQPWGREVTSGGLQPDPGGPRFAVTSNFKVIKRYNNSDAYAIGVGHLADRIGGAGPLRASFPPDANGLTKDDRIALQKGLTAKGFDTDGADGVIGPNSKKAIASYQSSIGMPATGDPSMDLLRTLGS